MTSKDIVSSSENIDKDIVSEIKEFKEPGEKCNIGDLSSGTLHRLRVGSLLRTWTEVSRVNYLSSQPLDVIRSSGSSIRRRSIGMPTTEFSMKSLVPLDLWDKSDEELFEEVFPVNVTSLMNEDQHWGCFYIFPELYADEFSPVVLVREAGDVPDIVDGVLTRDVVAAHLTYLKRTPILKDLVFIKLDLSNMHLVNIAVLQHYKYLVYLDLSSNLLTELSVLSYLLYLQCISLASNRLTDVLDYDTPQWFLTEVCYKYNSVTKIRDLSMFWSITILDLSHNNIKSISGLENLRYLRRLDLSFNHIQRLQGLSHLRLVWLDVSYNNISVCEFGSGAGLWTLLHLEYLNLNENNFTSMKMFSRCSRLRELHARNNSFSTLFELAVYMRQLRRLAVLDLRANPVCSAPGYRSVVLTTFPDLMSLDDKPVDAVDQRNAKMDNIPDVDTFAIRRLMRLLYIEQLSRARVSPYVLPADTTEVPIVVLVGYEAVGKGTLARCLARQCGNHIDHALLHTTATYHHADHYIEVTRHKFDDMLLAGEMLTYTEMNGESYGLSRQEAWVHDGKARVVCMDLIGALMLKHRGMRPYLILTTWVDKPALMKRQRARRAARYLAAENNKEMETAYEKSTLQVLLSGRIIITGILNEIFVSLPDEKDMSEFLIESECSLLMDSEARQAAKEYAREANLMARLSSSTTSLEDVYKHVRERRSRGDSLYSLYKESQATGEYAISDVNGLNSNLDNSFAGSKKAGDLRQSQGKQEKMSNLSRHKSVDFSRYASSTWKGLSVNPDSTKSSKSVTFTSQDHAATPDSDPDPSGLMVEPLPDKDTGSKYKSADKVVKSVSAGTPWLRGQEAQSASADDLELWLAFLTETGILNISEVTLDSSSTRAGTLRSETINLDDTNTILRKIDYTKCCSLSETTNLRDDYDNIHRNHPGLFWDVVAMDDPDEAFRKTKRIIKDIVNSQKTLQPIFDIDFANLDFYPTVQNKLNNIRKQIAPQRLFY